MSCGVGLRQGSDLALLWLWCRPAATTPIGPLAWELPYAAGAALKRQKKKKEKKKLSKIEVGFLISSLPLEVLRCSIWPFVKGIVEQVLGWEPGPDDHEVS